MVTGNGSVMVDDKPDRAILPASLTATTPIWVENLTILWYHRRRLSQVAAIALLSGLITAFVIPRHYESTGTMMPPEGASSGGAFLASMAGRALGGDMLGGLAASLLGAHSNGPLYVELLRSATVTGHLIDRFHLQRVYHTRYRVDAAKKLVRRTKVTQDKKSGVLTLTVTDTNPERARDMAQAYLDELNALVKRTSTSSAGRERAFIERRLAAAKVDLDRAQEAMSDFSSTHATIDIREQTRVTVEEEAKLQALLITTQGELNSLRQIYGDGNVRVRAAEARIGNLKKEIEKIGGSSAELSPDGNSTAPKDSTEEGAESVSFPPLLQLPRLGVPYANLYRNVHVQETVYELLTQQYEIARLQEARDVPALNVIDAPGIPEKKSFPPRALFTAVFTCCALLMSSALLIFRHRWQSVSLHDPRRRIVSEILQVAKSSARRATRIRQGTV
jgi:capsule polysaccharide export protein KpsE/RkpR